MMKKVLHSLFSDSGLFLWIFLIGAALRFFAPFEIPFTHDELSALYRLNFDSFSELIEGGVRVDGHPALVHIFLYYWTHWVGTNEFWVKLPFLLLGLGSLILLYKITKNWFNSSAALVATSFLATLQFPILYSQIARPYISGLFLVLLLVYFWTKYLFHTTHSKRMYWGMIVTATLCSYNHYFSLLFAVIVGITGLFYVTKENKRQYLLGLVTVVLLFTPHLGIFLDQLRLGGLSWLGKPSPYFLLEHLLYLFHFSSVVFLVGVGVLVTGIFKSKRLFFSKFQGIALIWFLLPILIGMGYSIWVKPVIQHSMLLFSFPFLLVLITSFLPNLSRIWKWAMVFLVLVTNSISLIEQREHYLVFYQQPFEQTFKMMDFVQEKHPETHFVLNGNPNYHAFYFSDHDIPFSSIFDSVPAAHNFRNHLKSLSTDYLYLSNVPSSLQEVANEVFPYQNLKHQGLNREDVLLSKKSEDLNLRIPNTTFFSSTYTNAHASWTSFESDSIFNEGKGFVLNEKQEFGPTLAIDLDTVSFTRFTQVHAKIEIYNPQNISGILVCELYKNNQRLHWYGQNVAEYFGDTDTAARVSAHLNVHLLNVIKDYHSLKEYRLKISYWNKDKQLQSISNFSVDLKRGNTREYGIIEAIP